MEPSFEPLIEAPNNGTLINKYKNPRAHVMGKEEIREQLKKGIWVYFFLLIFEGALRKWVLPGLATPLLIVRDPVAIWLLFSAWKNDEFPSNIYLWGMSIITIISIFTAILLGHGNLLVALYGARIFLFHFPVIFLIGRIFTREDVVKMGRMLVILAIPMFILIALQFYSPQSAYINRGIGGDTQGGGFNGGALGYYRPPGTFSFTTGNTQFFGFVSVFVMFFWLNPQLINRRLLLAGTIALIFAIPLSISRNLFFQVGVSIIFAVISIIRKPKFLGRMIGALFGVAIILMILSQISFFSNAIDALTSRFANASDSEGGIQNTIGNRLSAGFFEEIETPNLSFWGFGIGMGTNAGAQLLVGHADEFLIAEGEWGRLVGEMGAVLGIAAIVLRFSFCVKLLKESFKRLLKSDLLPWMMVSVSFQAVAQGQWAQPTALGFSIIMGGLSIAALKVDDTETPANLN